MSKKELLDDFLRSKLGELPNAPVGNFDTVENKLRAKKNQGILVLLLIPFLLSGLYWLGSFTEKDVYLPTEQQVAMPSVRPDQPQIETKQNLKLENEAVAIEANQFKKNAVPQADASINKIKTDATQKGKTPDRATTIESATENVLTSTKAGDAEPEPVVLEKSVASEITVQGNALPSAQNQDKVAFNAEENSAKMSEKVVLVNEAIPQNARQSVPQNSPAQTATLQIAAEDVQETSRWSVTLNFYPNYTFREFQVKPQYQAKVNNRYEGIINDSEKGGFAFNMGVDVRYHLGENLFLGSGVAFIQTKINGSYNFEIYSSQVADKNGNLIAEQVFAKPIQINQGIVQTYQFLQVPLHVSYQPWVNNKLRLIVEGGISYIRFLRADGKTIDYASLAVKDLSTMPFNTNMSSIDFKVGMSYYPTPKVAFGLEPTLMYFSKSLYAENCPVDVVPWSVGVNFNVRLRLF